MLRELQQQFIDALMRNDTTLSAHLNAANLLPEAQVRLYQASYHGGMLKALTEIYPVTKKILGGEFFDAMCMRYIKRTPCRFVDINNYGADFAQFTQQFAPAAELVYLPDVLNLEWAWHRAFLAADEERNDLSILSTYAPDTLANVRFKLDDSLSLIESPYPIDEIWQCNQNESSSDELINLDSGPCYLAVWRSGINMYIDPLDEDLYDFLLSVRENRPLSQIQQEVADIASHLSICLMRGYFSNFVT